MENDWTGVCKDKLVHTSDFCSYDLVAAATVSAGQGRI